MQRKIYLHMQSRQEAQERFWSRFAVVTTGEEIVFSRQACGRVTAGPVSAKYSSPSFHSAAMDGLAVRAEETFGASDEHPLTLHIDTGHHTAVLPLCNHIAQHMAHAAANTLNHDLCHCCFLISIIWQNARKLKIPGILYAVVIP